MSQRKRFSHDFWGLQNIVGVVKEKMFLVVFLPHFFLFSEAYNQTHKLNWGGHDNGMNLKTVICPSGSICKAKRLIEVNCYNWGNCNHPCQSEKSCDLVRPQHNICVRYECKVKN